MSLENPNEHDVQAAALRGMGGFHGDPEVGADLGIPMNPEDVARHYAAGQEVGRLVEQANQLPQLQPSPAAAAMHTWIAGADRSQLKIRAEIARQVKSGDIRGDEIEGLFEAIRQRKKELSRWPRQGR